MIATAASADARSNANSAGARSAARSVPPLNKSMRVPDDKILYEDPAAQLNISDDKWNDMVK